MANGFNGDHNLINGNVPSLRIVIQPQKNFRFRYTSENQTVGSHGCLLGNITDGGKTKIHPTVELLNYSGKALIKCGLAHHDNPEEHPHRLHDDDTDMDLSYVVPDHGIYAVGFPGMSIIQPTRKHVRRWILMKLQKQYDNIKNAKEIKTLCDKMMKEINLNIVRLKFSAHDVETKEEICEAIFSNPIYNMKNTATNDLKICRMSHSCGRACGGDDVIVLVDKVSKKDIEIWFYEETPNGERIWSAKARFMEIDVHHQYAISFRTPPYGNPDITSDVTVCVQLQRPSDGRTSKHIQYTYKADSLKKMTKRRKIAEARPVEAPVIVPLAVEEPLRTLNLADENEPQQVFSNLTELQNVQPIYTDQSNSQSNALSFGSSDPVLGYHLPTHSTSAPQMLEYYLNLFGDDSEEIMKYINHGGDNYNKRRGVLANKDLRGMSRSPAATWREKEHPRVLDISGPMSTDSGRGDGKAYFQGGCSTDRQPTKSDAVRVSKSSNKEYHAYYTAEDGAEVKKLVKELCEIVRNKKGHNKQELRNVLERLFEKRLSNGDTFLHMALINNQISFEFIVKVIHNVKLTFLLDLANDNEQTILHHAVAYNMPEIVSLLISKGCNPMIKDHEDNNAIHYAVRYQSCLETLLEAIKKNDVACDLNDCNNEKQSPLHVAAVHDCGRSARALVAAGASYSVRDTHARTPLHLAAYDDKLRAATALLDYITPDDIDTLDGNGNTALQIVCGGPVHENTRDIVKLLLEKKADPLKHEDHNVPAWKLACKKPEISKIIKEYLPSQVMYECDQKSVSEDEFESADEACG